MKLFKRDPAEGLQQARAALERSEAKEAELRAKRSDALLETDDIKTVADLDKAIGAEVLAASIHRDRIGALEVELRRQREEQRGRDKDAAVAAIEEKLLAKGRAAAELEKAIAEFGRAYCEYEQAAHAVFAVWPEDLLGDARRVYVGDAVALQIAGALGMKPEAADTKLREIVARVGEIADPCARASAAIIEAMHDAPLPALQQEAA